MTDYGRTETTPTNTDRTFGSDNACFLRQIDIPTGVTIGSLSWWPGATVATCKYRIVAWLRSGLYTCSGANLLDAAEITGTTAHLLTTVAASTTYTNSSGSTQSIYFGVNYIVARPGVMGYTESAVECPVFANGGTDVPPSAPTLTPNSNVYAIFVTSTVTGTVDALNLATMTLTSFQVNDGTNFSDPLATATITLTGKGLVISMTVPLGLALATLTAYPLADWINNPPAKPLSGRQKDSTLLNDRVNAASLSSIRDVFSLLNKRRAAASKLGK